MSRESVYDDYLEEQWIEEHGCTFKLDIPITLTISVKGYDTEEVEDLGERIDDAISELCEILYQDKKSSCFFNMERDPERSVDVMAIE